MQLAEVFTRLIGENVPVGFRGYDGSTAGPPAGVPVVELRDPIALRYLFTARRRDLGVARAYVTGALDVTGDLYSAMRVLRPARLDLSWSEALTLIRGLGGIRLLRPPPTPAIEARLSGRRHTRARDAAAIAHHYDRSNDLFALILGESMTYTCAFFDEPSTPLAQAQLAKHELLARQLDLQAGMRLLDVGCGWGTFVRYAASHYGVKALGVTLSRQQAAWAQQAIAAAGLAGLAEVRCLDYRDVPEADFDAIASIEMIEHVGRKNLAEYFRLLSEKLRPGGRLVNQCSTRPDNTRPELARAGFIDRYIFPDGGVYGPGELMSHMHDSGFELRSTTNLREHFALTLARWAANLDQRFEAACALADPQTARAWRLYLAACRLAFEEDRLELHQMLGVRRDKSRRGALG